MSTIQKISLGLGLVCLVLFAIVWFPKDWTSTCENGREMTREAYGRSGAPPAPPVNRSMQLGAVWVLDWAGVPIPIPAVDYDVVLLDHGSKPGLMELTLEAESPPTKVELRWEVPDAGLVNYWPGAFGEYLRAAPDGSQTFEEAFGEFFPTRGSWYARKHSLEDLTCEPSDAKADLPVLLSLIAYTSEISFGGRDERFDIEHPAILGGTAYPKGEGRWRVVLLPNDATIPPAIVTYEVGRDHAEIGHHVASPELRIAADAPVWLTPVDDLLERLDQQRLDVALDAFNRAALHPNSRLGLAELQRLIDGDGAWQETSPARKIEDRKKNEISF